MKDRVIRIVFFNEGKTEAALNDIDYFKLIAIHHDDPCNPFSMIMYLEKMQMPDDGWLKGIISPSV